MELHFCKRRFAANGDGEPVRVLTTQRGFERAVPVEVASVVPAVVGLVRVWGALGHII